MPIALKVTLLRILFSPVFVIVFLIDNPWCKVGALAISLINDLTDALDGALARNYNGVTKLGKLLDPFADKIAKLTILLCLLAYDQIFFTWMFLIVFWRELFVSLLREVALGQGLVISARKLGKIKTVFQSIAINIVLAVIALQALAVRFNMNWFVAEDVTSFFQSFNFSLLLAMTIFTAYTGIIYLYKYRSIFSEATHAQ